jgi:hypothetical protein
MKYYMKYYIYDRDDPEEVYYNKCDIDDRNSMFPSRWSNKITSELRLFDSYEDAFNYSQQWSDNIWYRDLEIRSISESAFVATIL